MAAHDHHSGHDHSAHDHFDAHGPGDAHHRHAHETRPEQRRALLISFLLTGGFVWPVDRLPGVVADIARLSPASAFSEAVRLSLGADQGALTTPLLVITLWAAVLGIAAARTFRAE